MCAGPLAVWTCVLLCLFCFSLPTGLHACLIPCWFSCLLPRLGACLHICLLASQLVWLIDCLTASFTPHLPSCPLYRCLFAHFCAFVLVRLFTCFSAYLLAYFFHSLRVCFTLITCSLSALPLPCQFACFVMNLLTCLGRFRACLNTCLLAQWPGSLISELLCLLT